MDQLRRAARGAGREVVGLDQYTLDAQARGEASDTGTRDASADDGELEALIRCTSSSLNAGKPLNDCVRNFCFLKFTFGP